MSEFNANQDIKKLYVTLIKMDIAGFLITEPFNLLLIELDLDNIWKAYEKEVYSRTNVIIAVPGYTGDAKEILIRFMDGLYSAEKTKLFSFVIELISKFSEKHTIPQDLLTELNSRLKNLGQEGEITLKPKKIEVATRTSEEQKVSTELFPTKDFRIDEKLCFVLMPFDAKYDAVYQEVIKPTGEEKGLDVKRADDIFSVNPIIVDIWENINKARVLIADVSGRNPNVFYEIGISHTLKKKVIIITRNLDDIPFDLRHLRCIVYEDSLVGAKQLKEALSKTLDSILSNS